MHGHVQAMVTKADEDIAQAESDGPITPAHLVGDTDSFSCLFLSVMWSDRYVL